jgi:hypothetical protein
MYFEGSLVCQRIPDKMYVDSAMLTANMMNTRRSVSI